MLIKFPIAAEIYFFPIHMSICSLSFVKISTSDPKKKPPSLAPRGVEISHQLTQQGMFLHQAPLHRLHHLQHPKPPGWEPGGSTVSWDGLPFRIFQSRVTLWNWEEWPTLCPSQPAKNLGKWGKEKMFWQPCWTPSSQIAGF